MNIKQRQEVKRKKAFKKKIKRKYILKERSKKIIPPVKQSDFQVEKPEIEEDDKLKTALEYIKIRSRMLPKWGRENYVQQELKKYKLWLKSERLKKEEESKKNEVQEQIEKTNNDIHNVLNNESK